MNNDATPVYLAASPAEYARLGLNPAQIELWEDGMRTDGRRGNYEWWYFDTHLNDGSKLVIVFYTKPMTEVYRSLSPLITVNLDRADGTRSEWIVHAPAAAFSAAHERCDVRIGPNFFQGDLHTYHIHVEVEELVADVTLRGTVPAWRPETGHLVFGQQAEHYFAWLPSVPQGQVEAIIRIGGDAHPFTGIGYHDHNWGNVSMVKLMNNWYWARGAVGSYTTIASLITTEKRYGHRQVPVFLLARDHQILADNGSYVQFEASDIFHDEETGKPVANLTRYRYHDGAQQYIVTFRRKQTILRQRFIEQLRGLTRLGAKLARFDGAYLRFTGEIQLDRYDGETLVESVQETGIWELMYFGRVHKK